MKIGKINLSYKEVFKWLMFSYLPLFCILFFTRDESLIWEIELALFFSYPLYLRETLNLKKFIKWILVGMLPSFILFKFILKENWNTSLEVSALAAYFMYPMTIGTFSTLKDILIMGKEMNFIQKTIMLVAFLFITLTILRQFWR